MTEVYGPFFSGAGDTFNETQWREFFGNIVTSGVFKGGLVNGVAGGDLAVTAPGGSMTVNVGTGLANAYGFFYENDASRTLTLAGSDATLNRIDYIIVQLLFTSRTVLSAVLTGTLASSPVAPTLVQNATTWDIPLATVAVNHGVTTVTSANVTDQRHYLGSLPPASQGVGSGLNADLVDGLNSSAFVLGASASQHIVIVNRVPTNSDGVDGDLIFQW